MLPKGGLPLTWRRGGTRLAGVACVVLALTACSRNPEPGLEDRPPASPVGDGLQLPIDDYQFSPGDIATYEEAQHLVVQHCMSDLGFEVPAHFVRQALPMDRTARRFKEGAAAVEHGYHGDQPESDALAAYLASWPDDAAFLAALRGDRTNGGCELDATRELSGGDEPYGFSRLVSRLDRESFEQSRNDAVVQAAMREWSVCMAAAHGYQYLDPLEPAGAVATEASPSPLEIATAVADVECKERTDLVARWHEIDIAIQRRLIDENIEQLEAVQAGMRAELDRATAVVTVDSWTYEWD